eukprot:403148-Lingulodinium_polyedra.AAC.1
MDVENPAAINTGTHGKGLARGAPNARRAPARFACRGRVNTTRQPHNSRRRGRITRHGERACGYLLRGRGPRPQSVCD